MLKKSFSYSEVLGFGWHVMKSNFWFFAGVLIVTLLISLIGQIAGQIIAGLIPFMLFVMFVVSFVIQTIMAIGLIKITLSFCDNKKPGFSTLFNGFDCFLRYIGTGFLYMLILCGTSAVFILPPALWTGILHNSAFAIPFFIVLSILLISLSIKYSLCFYFAIDKGLGPINAIKASGLATEGAKLSLFVFGILCGLINLLGMLCLYVGLFVTVPMVMVAMAYVYRQLSLQTPELAELGIADASVNPIAQGGFGGSAQPFAGMQSNPIIPGIQSIQSEPCVRPVQGAQPVPIVKHEGEKKHSRSSLQWVIALVVCVIIAAGIGYYFLTTSKSKVADSLKDAAISLKDAASSKNLELKGILYSEDNPSAVIGNKIVKEGDTINGVKVVKINRDTVEFDKDGEKWTQQTR